METEQKRKRWGSEEIVGILRRVLLERADISKVCEEAGCLPSQVYRWQKDLFERGAVLFARKRDAGEGDVQEANDRAAALEAKLRRKDEVLAELMEEHVRLKKTSGEA